jgi:hypothetical protein
MDAVHEFGVPQQPTPAEPTSHRTFWLTSGAATILAAIIGVVSALIIAANHGEPQLPRTAGPGATATQGSTSAGAQAGVPTGTSPADRYVTKYQHITFRVPRPEDCQDPTVSFEGDTPVVTTEDAFVARNNALLDLYYENCNPEQQLWLYVPAQQHSIARVSAELTAAQCAQAANLQQIGKNIPADALKAGQRYCMRTYNNYVVEFTIQSVTAGSDLTLTATTWLDTAGS